MIFEVIAAELLSPVLLVQAVYVRSRALELPEPPGDRAGVVAAILQDPALLDPIAVNA